MLNRKRNDLLNFSSDESLNTTGSSEVMLYSCATMWHENQHEMLKLLTSIMRLDKDQSERQKQQRISDTIDPDYYEYEAHIFFDDTMKHENEDTFLNSFVLSFLNVVNEAAS